LLLLVLLEYSLKENILAMPLRKVFKNDFLSLFILLIYLKSVVNESREGEWVIILYMFLFSPKYPFYVMSVHLCLIITGTKQKYFQELHYALKKLD